MKLIIAGGRKYRFIPEDYGILDEIHRKTPVTEVVSGRCTGADACGEAWANRNKIPVIPMEAKWDDLTHPEAIIRTREDGTEYNANAGPIRNAQMAAYADAVALFPGHNGTASMFSKAREARIKIYDYRRVIVGNVRNKRQPPLTSFYLGRDMPGRIGSPLGNPFKIKNESERAEAYEKYGKWLDRQMESDTPARQAIYTIATFAWTERVLLLCWCAPKLCHCDYVKQVIDKLMLEKTWGNDADSHAQKIHCKDCNGYLWEANVFDHVPQLIPCPYKKGPGDHCESNT